MNRFIAYFDYLGFKEFIENNSLEVQNRIIGNNFRDMESALGQGKVTEVANGLIADISNSRINCINFSDTVVFFTNDITESSLLEILDVSLKFNWQSILHCFPVRGALVYGELVHVGFNQHNSGGGAYNINSVYGKGLVNAYIRAEQQDWAGTVLDESFIYQMLQMGLDVVNVLAPYSKKYTVPYKDATIRDEEFVLHLINGSLNDAGLRNFGESITRNFGEYNKPVNNPSVQRKLSNTLRFLKTYHIA